MALDDQEQPDRERRERSILGKRDKEGERGRERRRKEGREGRKEGREGGEGGREEGRKGGRGGEEGRENGADQYLHSTENLRVE